VIQTAASVTAGPSPTATLVVAIVGLVLSVAGLVWQAASFHLTGPRVRVELQVGLLLPGGSARVPVSAIWRDSLRHVQQQQGGQPIVGFVIRNIGRGPTTITSYTAKADNGMGYGLTSAPPGTEPLPHRIEAHSMAFYYIDMLGVAAAAAAYGSVKDMPRRFHAQVELGSGKTVTSAQTLDARELVDAIPALQSGTV